MDERFVLGCDIEWSAGGAMQTGRLADLSKSGCFILAAGDFLDEEIVLVYFPLSDGKKIEFVGKIVNHVSELGFAIRFNNLTDVQRQFVFDFAQLYQSDGE